MTKTSNKRKAKAQLIEELQKERDLLQALMDNIPDHIYFKDTESRFIRVSKSVAELFDMDDPAQAVGKTDFDFFTEDHARPAYEDEQRIIKTGQPILGIEERETWPDRPDTWARTSKMPLRDQEGNIVGTFGISNDITEIKKAEAERERLLADVRQSERLLRSIINATPDWIFIKDQQHRYVMVNQSYADALHLTPDDFVNKNDLDMEFAEELVKGNPEKGIRGFWADDCQVMDSGKPLVISRDLATIDGELHIFNTVKTPLRDTKGEVWGVLGLARDLTERERLLADLEQRSAQLQTAAEVSRAASSTLDPDALIQQVVDLARERFDLYYAGLFLVDKAGAKDEPGDQWAVLRAGTAEAGQKMLEQGHKLKVGGSSMIGWCVANKQARIALDVGEEAVRFDNPLLPETHSELALPLVSRGEAIGALTIQSTQEAAFSDEDIAVLQTMADQLANAIANARLYKALTWEQHLMQALMDNIPDYIYFKDTESRFIRNSKSHAELFGVCDPAQLVGKSDSDFFTEEHARGAYDDEQRIITTAQPVVDIEEKGIHPDGREEWYLTTKMPLRDEKGNIIGTFGISKDITERKQAAEREARRQEWLETVLELGKTVAQVTDEQPCLLTIYKSVRQKLRFDRVGLFLYDSDGDVLRGVYGTNRNGEMDDMSWFVQPVAEHEAFREILSDPRNFVFTPDYSAKFPTPPEHDMHGVKEHIAIAAWAGDKPVAMIFADNVITGQRMTEEQIEALRLFAHHAGLAIENARLYTAIQRELTERERLLADLEQRSAQLQTAAEVSRAASSTLDPDALIQQVVDLARERFDLYYAGLFLVDKAGAKDEPGDQWAVLRAGTAEAGQKMLEQGHKLKVGGSSMIGWCVANKQARIALDVGEEAVRFDNPLLPETHSELALPLVSRGEAIGALTIQSTQEAAFSDEDIAVLQTMADQLANAIANAQLYEQAQQEIAERKRAEEALAQQAEELTLSLEQFAHVASHDLQEPLRMVASYAKLLEQRYKGRLDEDADEFIAYAVEGATRMHRLINDLLAYWRIGTRGKPLELTDCAVILSRVLANLRAAIENIGATVIQDNMPKVMADAEQLTQVFQNLIINAIQFRSDRPPEIHIGAERRDNMWVFSVCDNGIGIEPQYFERIFKIFQRLHTRTDHEGTGIGLAVCKKIVERHGGRMWVDSEPGKGSTFYFTIPDEGDNSQ
jgi:PAS domain S-box-containing protein